MGVYVAEKQRYGQRRWPKERLNTGMRAVHPFVAFFYYVAAGILCMLLFHPFFLVTAVIAFLGLVIVQGQARQLRKQIVLFLVTGLFILLFNPLFSHRGAHILFYFWDNPITLESVLYGVTMTFSIFSIFILFISYNYVVTSQKFLYLFSGVTPKGALLAMMALRFVPLLRRRLRTISLVQRTRGIYMGEGSLRKRVRDGLQQLQVLVTWSLEEAVQTADSMVARGYGTGKRSTFQAFSWHGYDGVAFGLMLATWSFCIMGWLLGYGSFVIYPKMESLTLDRGDWMIYGVFLAYLLIPIFMEGKERRLWR